MLPGVRHAQPTTYGACLQHALRWMYGVQQKAVLHSTTHVVDYLDKVVVGLALLDAAHEVLNVPEAVDLRESQLDYAEHGSACERAAMQDACAT